MKPRYLIPVALLLLTAFQNSVKTGGTNKLGGTSTLGVSQGIAPSGSTVPIGDPPLAGAPTSCSSLYEGVYEYGLYKGCVNTISAGAYATALAAATTATVPLNSSGTTSGCPTNCVVIIVGTGMSVALAEFNSYETAANSSGLQKSTAFNSTQAFSNNDLPVWTVSTPGVPPPPCLTTGNSQECTSAGIGPSTNCAALGSGTGSVCNEFDVIATRIPSVGSHSLAQIQNNWEDTSNGQGHPYLKGCCPNTTAPCDQIGTSVLYQICAVLDGVHQVNGGSTCATLTTACITLINTIDTTNTLYELGEETRAKKAVWPNLQIVEFSSRVYAGYCTTGCADPYPFEYEKAFAIKALIHAQRCEMGDDGCTLGTIDTVAGDLCPSTTVFPGGCGSGVSGSAPMLTWADVQASASDDATIHSGYFWANDDLASYNGGNGRYSDGLAWCNGQSGYCAGELDFASPDFIHLTTAGAAKAGNQTLGFFEHSPFSKPWWHI